MIRSILGAVAVAILSTPISAETYRSAEYGYLFQTSKESVQLWDESASFCVLNMEVPRARDQMFEVMGLRFAEEGDEAKLWIDGMLRPIRGTRIESLPSTCLDKDYSPSEIVALVGETFAERYPFFHLYDVDWSARVADVQSALPEGASEEDLREALMALVSGLEDGHIEVSFGEDSFSPEVLPVWAEAAQDIGLITHSYVDDLTRVDGVQMIYGRIGDVGYMRIWSMGADAEFDENARDVAQKKIQSALMDLGEVSALILDARLNSGGFDAIGLAYASAFNDVNRPAFSRVFHTPDGQGPSQRFEVPTAEAPFTRPVYVMTGPMAFSAAETFVLAMAQIPHVTLVGDPTAGDLSDKLLKAMPNGWRFALSHQIYRAPDGAEYENLGIPVDWALPFDLDGFQSERDMQLEAVLNRLGQPVPNRN